MLHDIESSVLAAHGAKADAALSLASLPSMLEIIGIVRDLSALASITEGLDTPEGIQKRIDAFLSLAVRAALLTETKADDSVIETLRKYLAVQSAAELILAVQKYAKDLKAA